MERRPNFARPAVYMLVLSLCWGCEGVAENAKSGLQIRVELSGVSNTDELEHYRQQLQDLLSHDKAAATGRMEDKLGVVEIGPVADVDAFAKQIPFGQASAPQGNIIRVNVTAPPAP